MGGPEQEFAFQGAQLLSDPVPNYAMNNDRQTAFASLCQTSGMFT